MASECTRVLIDGIRRFVLLTLVVIVAAGLVSAALGLLLGEGARRSVTVGLYLTGSLLVVLAFFVSTRPPARADGEGGATRITAGSLLSMSGSARFTSPQERRDNQAISWLLVAVGLVVVIVAALADGRHALI